MDCSLGRHEAEFCVFLPSTHPRQGGRKEFFPLGFRVEFRVEFCGSQRQRLCQPARPAMANPDDIEGGGCRHETSILKPKTKTGFRAYPTIPTTTF